MSDELKSFYRNYLRWVEAGAPEENEYGFSINVGLCNCLVDSLWLVKRLSNTQSFSFLYNMKKQFVEAGLDEVYPFDGSKEAYNSCEDMTKNPARMAWVRAHQE